MIRGLIVAAIAALLVGITTRANAIDEIAKEWGTPMTVCGIRIDYAQVEMNRLTFVCHIDKESKTYQKYLKVVGLTDMDSVKQKIEQTYENYGGTINLEKINLWGTPYDENWILYMMFKSQMVTCVGQFINTYKLGDELRKAGLIVQFDIKGNGFVTDNPNQTIHRMTCDMSDFGEVATIVKYGCDVDKVITQKYTMFRGFRLNQKALPTQVGWGVTLDSMKIQRNSVVYYNGVSDFIANSMSTEDIKGSIEQVRLNMGSALDIDKLKETKGLPLLNIKLGYKWYRESNGEKIASVTFAYPSLDILEVWPDFVKQGERSIDYTDEDESVETECIPICLYDPVDLGLSVSWSSMNLGAEKVDDYGGLYGCGDITGKLTSRDTCDYRLPDSIKTIQGNPSYDIVRHVKGEWWHMPTSEEWTELFKNSIVVSAAYKGVKGYKIIGPNGRAVFLPASGYRDAEKKYDREEWGKYWSSDVSDENGNCNVSMWLSKKLCAPVVELRWRGMSVRPVREY